MPQLNLREILSRKETFDEMLNVDGGDFRMIRSQASQDEHYVSAFINELIKMWLGEVGAVIWGNSAVIIIQTTEADNIEAMRLIEILMEYNGPCSE